MSLVIGAALVVFETLSVTAARPASLERLPTPAFTGVLGGAERLVVPAALPIEQAAVVALAGVASVVAHTTSVFTA